VELPERKLTQRERQVIGLLGAGKSHKRAAAELGMAVRTVETHRAKIMLKLGLSSLPQLIQYALRNGLIAPDSTSADSRREELAQPVLVECHADHRVDAHAFEGIYFPLCFNAPRGDDGMRRGTAQLLEPPAIGSAHCSFTIHICAEKCGAKRLKLPHDLFGLNGQLFSPALNHNVAFGGVEGDHNRLATHSRAEAPEKGHV
jgi:DNA-binding CsgD family transcriptional regulator